MIGRVAVPAFVCAAVVTLSGCGGGPAPQLSCPMASEQGCGTVTFSGGSFTMGGDTTALSDTPAQTSITVSGFTLDAYEVTVSRFRRFWSAGHPMPPGGSVQYPGGTVAWGGMVTEPALADGQCTWSEMPDTLEAHPINCVDWNTAQAFCVWDGGRLPTEAEWEYAARGNTESGLAAGRAYPWGATDPTACDRAEWDDCSGDDDTATTRVGDFAPTGGVYDLAGNVYEWTADWYADYTNAQCWNGVPQMDPVCNVSTSQVRGIRGGSWYSDIAYLRGASRSDEPPATQTSLVGFRCAR